MTTGDGDRLRALLGSVGIWSNLGGLEASEIHAFAGDVETLGFGTLWINEGLAREPFVVLGALARSTTRLALGLGIASIHARDAAAAHAGARTVAELTAGRFVMGLGVSHRSTVERRGHEYASPLGSMAAYLDAYEAAPWTGPEVADPPLVLAALGPAMLELAATRADGAFPFLVTVDHVADARRRLDDAARAAGRPEPPALVVAQLAMLGSGADVRAIARAAVARYAEQPNYRNNLLRIGIAGQDVDDLSDGLVDALVATGTATELRARVEALHAAGADHVAVIPVAPDGRQADLAVVRALAPRH